MKLGVMTLATDRSMAPDALAAAVEARGFDALLLGERSHVPTDRGELWPGGPPLPDSVRRTLDPLLALGWAARSTSTLRLGTAACVLAGHDPVTLAKQLATLDHAAPGRLLVGVGFGWNPEEMRNHGVDPAALRAVVRERVEAMRELWTREQASYQGRHVRLSPSWAWPKPAEPPPILLCTGPSAAGLAAVVDYGDGWMPHARLHRDIPDAVRRLRGLMAAAGRDPQALRVVVASCPADAGALRGFAAAGAELCLLEMQPGDDADTLRRLDRYAALI